MMRPTCDGVHDADGPLCAGDDVRWVEVRDPRAIVFTAHWCRACRLDYTTAGYRLTRVSGSPEIDGALRRARYAYLNAKECDRGLTNDEHREAYLLAQLMHAIG